VREKVRRDKPLVHVIGGRDCRPFMPVRIYDVVHDGLLDSGSEISIINNTILNLLPDKVVVSRSCDLDEIKTANGSASPVTGLVRLPVTVGDRTVSIQFYIIPGVTTSLLLGINF
jgi:hypothetical protein